MWSLAVFTVLGVPWHGGRAKGGGMTLWSGLRRSRRWRGALLASGLAIGAVVAAVGPSSPVAAQLTGLPSGFVDELVVGGLPFPTAVAFAPTGTTFVALKRGEVRVYEGATALGTFIDISARVHDNHDRGLLGLAVHPEFPAQPYVYLLYTHDDRPAGVAADLGSPVQGRTSQLLRVTADPNPAGAPPYTRAVAGSEVVLLGRNSVLANIGNPNDGRNTSTASCMNPKNMSGTPVEDCIPSDENSHTIGTVTFAPDGSMLVSSGDGSNYSAVDPRAMRAQLLDSLAGKVLRIDPITGLGLPDNPYYDSANPNRNRSKVYASGLRNPFRITVDPVSGEAFIGDVGWSTWEEINTGKGANFGWPCYEGGSTITPESGSTSSLQQSSYRTSTATSAACASLYSQGVAAVRAPTFAYNHAAGGASANAGAFYAGTTWPAQYQRALFIADYNRRLDPLPDVRRAGPGDSEQLRHRVDRPGPAARRTGHEPVLDDVQQHRRPAAPNPLHGRRQHAPHGHRRGDTHGRVDTTDGDVRRRRQLRP